MKSAKVYVPSPEVGLVFQDGQGERYIITRIEKRWIGFCPVQHEERARRMAPQVWTFGFTHRGWLAF